MTTNKLLAPHPPRSVVLVGMMAVGKTTVGQRLAARYGLPFSDSDEEISAIVGMPFSKYFRDFGEAKFREAERQAMASLLAKPVHVIAAAGGSFMDEGTRLTIKQTGISVWLQGALATNFDRAVQGQRNSMKCDDPKARFEKIYAERAPIYSQADLVVVNDGKIEETVEKIITAVAQFSAAKFGSAAPR